MNQRILLVDDDAMLRKLYSSAFAAHGFDIETSTSGQEALTSLAERQPGLIVLDVMMPGMDGIETCKRIRAAHGGRTPVLFLTANDSIRILYDILQAGGDDFLVKGVPLNDVIERARFWLSSALRGLPASIRVKACGHAAHALGENGGARADKASVSDIDARLAECLKDAPLLAEAEAGGDDAAQRRALGYVMGAVEYWTDRNLRLALRFPDYFASALRHCGETTRARAAAILENPDSLYRDPAFGAAMSQGTRDAAA